MSSTTSRRMAVDLVLFDQRWITIIPKLWAEARDHPHFLPTFCGSGLGRVAGGVAESHGVAWSGLSTLEGHIPMPSRRPLLLSWSSPQDHLQVLTKPGRSRGQALCSLHFFSPAVSEPQPAVQKGTSMQGNDAEGRQKPWGHPGGRQPGAGSSESRCTE